MKDQPIYGVQYALTGTKDTPCIANGNTWAESRVDFSPEQIEGFKESQSRIITEANEPMFNYSGHGTEGSKFRENQHLTTTQIAKLIRSEIRAKFPMKKGYKIGVKTEYFAGGSAIDIRVNQTPFNSHTDLYKQCLANNDREPIFQEDEKIRRNGGQIQSARYTNEYLELERVLKAIVNQYNFDDCDSQSDYFHVNYYSNIVLDAHCK